MLRTYGTAFILGLIIAFNLDMFLGPDATFTWGLAAGALAGIGWVAASIGTMYLFEQKVPETVSHQCGIPCRQLHRDGRHPRRLVAPGPHLQGDTGFPPARSQRTVALPEVVKAVYRPRTPSSSWRAYRRSWPVCQAAPDLRGAWARSPRSRRSECLCSRNWRSRTGHRSG